MTQLDDAVTRYHKLLESPPYRDLSWIEALRERMEEEQLSAGGRLLCPFLRPHFISRRQYESLTKSAEALIGAIDRVQCLVMQTPSLMARMELLPAEKMLANVDPGYTIPQVTAGIDSYLNNGTLRMVEYSADSPDGLAWSESLSDLFYDAPPIKEFRKRYNLTRIGGKKHLLSALLKAFRQFGGRQAPKIAIVEMRPPGQAFTSSEYTLFRDYFRREGYEAEVASPEQLEYRNGVLRKGNFEINLVFRRLSIQEFLMRFDLRHPLVEAYRNHHVCVVNSFRSELVHKKAIFGLLTDEAITQKFPAVERRAIHEHVPWTRLVTPSKTTYQGETIDLHDFILRNQEKLVLKPNDDHTGSGSFLGWEMDSGGWERALRETARSPYVVQEKVDSVRSTFPLATYGHLEFREMRVDLHPQAYLGKVMGCSSWLTAAAGSFTTAAGLTPTFILDPKA
ncbi:MAG: hypothetical protein WD696_17715 [Bryobacteraceae bacterium]